MVNSSTSTGSCFGAHADQGDASLTSLGGSGGKYNDTPFRSGSVGKSGLVTPYSVSSESAELSLLHDTPAGASAPLATLTVMDIWILLTCGHYSKLRSKVYTVLGKLVLEGALSLHHLQVAIRGYTTPIESMFPAMLALAQGALASNRLGKE